MMLTQYKLTMKLNRPLEVQPEMGYRLYAALIHELPPEYGRELHKDQVTPVSQFVKPTEKGLLWTVTLLGEESQQVIQPVISNHKEYLLQKDRALLTVTDCRQETLRDVDELFERSVNMDGCRLRFETPAAFKHHGKYVNLPSERLILQSLMKKWNGVFPDCPIEDTDGEGLDAMAEGLAIRRFYLHDRIFYLKGNPIRGFMGELTVENHLKGFHRDLANALLYFSSYAGIGIKTALGMGAASLVQPEMES